jgi:hypothetical protein
MVSVEILRGFDDFGDNTGSTRKATAVCNARSPDPKSFKKENEFAAVVI